jgi:hypothetical protein
MPKQDSKILNMYEKIPKEFLDKVENPNIHLHQLKLPFRMCIVAPSGSAWEDKLFNQSFTIIQLWT